jgi:hypothetical protein
MSNNSYHFIIDYEITPLFSLVFALMVVLTSNCNTVLFRKETYTERRDVFLHNYFLPSITNPSQ